METKDKKTRKNAPTEKEATKSTKRTNDSANDVSTNKASDRQAENQTEFEGYGQAGNRMSEQEYGEDKIKSKSKGTETSDQPNRQRSSDRSSGQNTDEGTPRGSSENDVIIGETGRRYDQEDQDQYHARLSDYERGFRDGSDHASKWHNQRNFEREQSRFGEQNRYGEYNEAYNPVGRNTGRNRGDYNQGYGYERSYGNQGFEDGGYMNRNTGYGSRGYGGSYNQEGRDYYRGYSDPGNYQGPQQSYQNQGRYDMDYGYGDLQRNKARYNEDRGRSDEYNLRNTGYQNSPEERLTGERTRSGNRHGASPGDYNQRNENDRSRSSMSSGLNRDTERRGEDGDYRRRREDRRSEGYDDPYRDYDW